MWNSWIIIGPCSVTCGGGLQTRERKCDNPPPSGGGSACLLTDGLTTGLNETDTIFMCNEGKCPIDGKNEV